MQALARHFANEPTDRRLFGHADHAVIIAAHADIRHEAGSSGHDMVVRGRDMGVGTEHGRYRAVEPVSEGHFLARRLAVKVDHDCRMGHAEPCARQNAFQRAERAVHGVHEQPSHDLGDEHPPTIRQSDVDDAIPRCAGGEVERSDDPLLLRDIGYDLLAVPGVVAEGYRIRSGGEQGVRHVWCEAETVRGVLPVDHRHIGGKLVLETRQGGDHRFPSGPAYHVTQVKEFHHCRLHGDMRYSLRACWASLITAVASVPAHDFAVKSR